LFRDCPRSQAELLLQIEQIRAWSLVSTAEREIASYEDQLESMPEVRACKAPSMGQMRMPSCTPVCPLGVRACTNKCARPHLGARVSVRVIVCALAHCKAV